MFFIYFIYKNIKITSLKHYKTFIFFKKFLKFFKMHLCFIKIFHEISKNFLISRGKIFDKFKVISYNTQTQKNLYNHFLFNSNIYYEKT